MECGGDVLYFGTLGHGGFRLARRLARRSVLHSLCGLLEHEQLVVVNAEGDEMELAGDGETYDLQSTNHIRCPYLLCSEEEVENGALEPSTQEQVDLFLERRSRILSAKRALIEQHYRRMQPSIYTFSEDILEPVLLRALQQGTPEALMSIVRKETDTGLFTFPFFTKEFCCKLVHEVHHFEASGLPSTRLNVRYRPNSMNNYGVILDDIGFTPFLNEIRTRCVAPFASLLFRERGGDSLDEHHGFVVQYMMSGDRALDFHFDDAEVTLNVCLGVDFEGGDLYFRGILEDPSTHDEMFSFKHVPGVALLHIGKHRHGASAIKQGERLNLILWCRSSAYRAAQPRGPCACGNNHHHHHHDDGQQ